MFTAPLDMILFFMATMPIAGWVSSRIHIPKLRDGYALLGMALPGWFLFTLYEQVKSDGIVVEAHSLPGGSSLEIDSLSIFMASAFILLGLTATMFSARYMEEETGLTEYYTLVLGMTAGMIGLVFAGDFLTFFLFWELMSITSYVLVAFRKRSKAAVEASYKYLVMSAGGAMLIAYAMSLIFGMTGTLNFAFIRESLGVAHRDPWLGIALALTLVGFGIKAAVVPFHWWLPDAHSEAPSPISALLSGIVITCGVYAVIRISHLLVDATLVNWQILLAALSIITMTVGNVMALIQSDIKRLLAYSSVAHIGYALIGITIGTQQGIAGALLHLFNHAIMKGLAFLSAGALISRTETREISQLGGIRKSMLLSSMMLSTSLLGLLGFPPLNGFVSKFILLVAAFEGNMPALAFAGALNTILSAGYYLRVVKTVLLDSPTNTVIKLREAPKIMLLPMISLSVLVIILGVYPLPLIGYAEKAAEAALNIERYVAAVVSK